VYGTDDVGAGPGIRVADESERGRIVMAEVSWLSDYVGGSERVSRGSGSADQGLMGMRGMGLTDDVQSWQERALCAETDPEAFFPEKGGSTREAKKICTGCEVKAECLEYALANDERFGIWGGLSERERRRLRRRAI
jgi:WhiB family transcriptional regulator, redox-sensing transcriptional regulator